MIDSTSKPWEKRITIGFSSEVVAEIFFKKSYFQIQYPSGVIVASLHRDNEDFGVEHLQKAMSMIIELLTADCAKCLKEWCDEQ